MLLLRIGKNPRRFSFLEKNMFWTFVDGESDFIRIKKIFGSRLKDNTKNLIDREKEFFEIYDPSTLRLLYLCPDEKQAGKWNLEYMTLSSRITEEYTEEDLFTYIEEMLEDISIVPLPNFPGMRDMKFYWAPITLFLLLVHQEYFGLDLDSIDVYKSKCTNRDVCGDWDNFNETPYYAEYGKVFYINIDKKYRSKSYIDQVTFEGDDGFDKAEEIELTAFHFPMLDVTILVKEEIDIAVFRRAFLGRVPIRIYNKYPTFITPDKDISNYSFTIEEGDFDYADQSCSTYQSLALDDLLKHFDIYWNVPVTEDLLEEDKEVPHPITEEARKNRIRNGQNIMWSGARGIHEFDTCCCQNTGCRIVPNYSPGWEYIPPNEPHFPLRSCDEWQWRNREGEWKEGTCTVYNLDSTIWYRYRYIKEKDNVEWMWCEKYSLHPRDESCEQFKCIPLPEGKNEIENGWYYLPPNWNPYTLNLSKNNISNLQLYSDTSCKWIEDTFSGVNKSCTFWRRYKIKEIVEKKEKKMSESVAKETMDQTVQGQKRATKTVAKLKIGNILLDTLYDRLVEQVPALIPGKTLLIKHSKVGRFVLANIISAGGALFQIKSGLPFKHSKKIDFFIECLQLAAAEVVAEGINLSNLAALTDKAIAAAIPADLFTKAGFEDDSEED
jgi:dihydroneopterin aldolase